MSKRRADFSYGSSGPRPRMHNPDNKSGSYTPGGRSSSQTTTYGRGLPGSDNRYVSSGHSSDFSGTRGQGFRGKDHYGSPGHSLDRSGDSRRGTSRRDGHGGPHSYSLDRSSRGSRGSMGQYQSADRASGSCGPPGTGRSGFSGLYSQSNERGSTSSRGIVEYRSRGIGDYSGNYRQDRGRFGQSLNRRVGQDGGRPQTVQQTTEDRVVKMNSNYFELAVGEKWCLCQYHVEFDPPEERTNVKKAIMRKLQAEYKMEGYLLFDGSSMFSTSDNYPHVLTTTRRNGVKVTIKIKFVSTIEKNNYQYLQVFNVLFRECMSSLNLKLIRRDYYDPAAKIDIHDHGLELWPGYKTSVLQCQSKILLQAEIGYKVLRTETAYNILMGIMNDQRINDKKSSFDTQVIGSIIMTRYNNRTYRVDDVDYQTTPICTFTISSKHGETIQKSYLEYYQEKYNLRIKDQKQPMLISRSKVKERRPGEPELIYLIPELCYMTGLSEDMRKKHILMKDLSQNTNVGPSERIKRLMQFNSRINGITEIKEKLDKWNITLVPTLISIPGTVFGAETINFGENRAEIVDQARLDWTNQFRNYSMMVQVPLNKWAIVYPEEAERDVNKFLDHIFKCVRGMHFVIDNPRKYRLTDDRTWNYKAEIENCINRENPQLVCIILKNSRGDGYSTVKKSTIHEKAIPSQVVLMNTIRRDKSLISVATKIAIQMNCKIGGAAWGIRNLPKGVMSVGVDIASKNKAVRRGFSAMVATMNDTCTQYFSNAFHYENEKELATQFINNLKTALEQYRLRNMSYPQNIVIYRDGVGEGNLVSLYENEVKPIENNLNSLFEKNKLKLQMCFVVVSKRVNTRIFVEGENPPSGTVIDSEIVRPARQEFFLVSQSARQGTVSPTHYNLLLNSSMLSLTNIQKLTYQFTHLYFNWSGTVRVPAPCLYARKLATLTAENIGSTTTNLSDKLWYL